MAPAQTGRVGTFAHRLAEAQADAAMTSEALARRLDVSVRLVQRWRAGPAQPSGQNLVALAAILDRDPGWFFAAGEKAAA